MRTTDLYNNLALLDHARVYRTDLKIGSSLLIRIWFDKSIASA